MSNTSATGGYLVALASSGLPGGLTLNQFLQTVLVGISGLPGSFVRPNWQEKPPSNPDLSVNWLAFGVILEAPDYSAYVGQNDDGSQMMSRQEGVQIKCTFYGPLAMTYARIVRNGFQLSQNLEALRAAKMGFVNTDAPIHVPELVNERFIDRIEMAVHLRRQEIETYPVLNVLSAEGTIHTIDGEFNIPWQTPEGS